MVLRIEKSVQLRPASTQSACHFSFCYLLFSDLLLDHASYHFLDGTSFYLFIDSFFAKKIVEVRSNAFIWFHLTPLDLYLDNLSCATFKSCSGNFWDSLIKPCKRTINAPSTANKIRAIRFPKFDLTSHISPRT